jgi:predicted methyltransferase
VSRTTLPIAILIWLVSAAALSAQTARPQQPPSGVQPPQSSQHTEVPREQWQRIDDVFAALGAGPGRHIADIGAGGGYFTIRLARVVGENGRVYAVDVNPVSLRELRTSVGEAGNVEIIRGEENDPKLPANALDAALVVNAYHEFAEYGAMLERIRAALKPGGRLVLIEPIPRTRDATRAAQTKQHSIALELVEAEAIAAGFEVVVKDPGFITRPHHGGAEGADASKPTDWLLVVRRPATSN